MIETDEWGDIYLGPEDLCTVNADTVYITIVGDNFTNATNVSISASNGDVSTGKLRRFRYYSLTKILGKNLGNNINGFSTFSLYIVQ